MATPTAVNRHFVRHYLEMVAAMFLGMGIIGIPAGLVLGTVGSGWSELRSDAPALMFILMAFTMTVPMVAWMRYRGHGWQPCIEMTWAMLVPTFVAIGVLGAGLVGDVGALLIVEHVAMCVGMLAVMLVRPGEYSHHGAPGAQAGIA